MEKRNGHGPSPIAQEIGQVYGRMQEFREAAMLEKTQVERARAVTSGQLQGAELDTARAQVRRDMYVGRGVGHIPTRSSTLLARAVGVEVVLENLHSNQRKTDS